ncbi:hypothetical protein Csa_022336 [Cucumis sativus]|uniref:Uncharacterized protein n=1 Tax=Cucumis sativus TaxID=3659 RepID=A0A0A0LSI2_CUCSA|nr:hypothetical protein Csa_022336 [Cucumis sativus]
MTVFYKQPILILRPYSVHLDLTHSEPALPTILHKDNSTLGMKCISDAIIVCTYNSLSLK